MKECCRWFWALPVCLSQNNGALQNTRLRSWHGFGKGSPSLCSLKGLSVWFVLVGFVLERTSILETEICLTRCFAYCFKLWDMNKPEVSLHFNLLSHATGRRFLVSFPSNRAGARSVRLTAEYGMTFNSTDTKRRLNHCVKFLYAH